jgi:multiple sugar transport system permease protein
VASVSRVSGVASEPRARVVTRSPALSRQLRGLTLIGTVTLFATMLVTVYLMPLAYSAAVAFRGATVEAGQPIWPSEPAKFTYNGESYDVYNVPIDGTMRQLALVRPARENATWIDPANPSQPIEWTGRWRTLDRVWNFAPQWSGDCFSTPWPSPSSARSAR